MKCCGCDLPVVKVPWPFTYRRDDKVLFVELKIWECQSGCKDFDEEDEPFRFVDVLLWRENDLVAEAAWQQAYNEPMPKGRGVE